MNPSSEESALIRTFTRVKDESALILPLRPPTRRHPEPKAKDLRLLLVPSALAVIRQEWKSAYFRVNLELA